MPAKLPSVSDTELIQRCRQGDESAYGQIVQRYQSLVCSVAYSRCGDLGMSEDLAQEAFIQAWKKLADLSDVSKFKSWICTIVRNLASRSKEKSVRNVATGAARLDAVVEPVSAATAPIERVISAEQEQLVWQAIAGIPENYREPMILFYREEQSVARVAAALDISQDAVKQRLSRGRKFLQEQLAATVQSTLENSKPSSAFAGAVLMGLTGANANTTTAAVATSVAGKTAAANAGFGSTFLAPIMNLPIIAWLCKVSFDESRSPQERKIVGQFLVTWVFALVPMAALMYASSFWLDKDLPPALRGLVIPIIMVLYCIPMVYSSRRMTKRIEQLRIEENTATPPRRIVAADEQRGSLTRLFLGSGLLVAIWPVLMSIYSGDWIGVSLLLVSAVGLSLTGARFVGKSPTRSFRAYGVSLGGIFLIGIAVLYFRNFNWSGSQSSHFLWSMGATQAMLITHLVLTTVAWKRVHGLG